MFARLHIFRLEVTLFLQFSGSGVFSNGTVLSVNPLLLHCQIWIGMHVSHYNVWP